MADVRVEHQPPPTRPTPRGAWRVILIVAVIFALAAWVTCAAGGFPM
jgi:hypothetical protein